MTDAGNTGDGSVETGRELGVDDLSKSANKKSKPGNIETDVIEKKNFSGVFVFGKIKGFLKKRENKEEEHSEHEVMGMHYGKIGSSVKADEFGELTVKNSEYHCDYCIDKSKINVFLAHCNLPLFLK